MALTRYVLKPLAFAFVAPSLSLSLFWTRQGPHLVAGEWHPHFRCLSFVAAAWHRAHQTVTSLRGLTGIVFRRFLLLTPSSLCFMQCFEGVYLPFHQCRCFQQWFEEESPPTFLSCFHLITSPICSAYGAVRLLSRARPNG